MKIGNQINIRQNVLRWLLSNFDVLSCGIALVRIFEYGMNILLEVKMKKMDETIINGENG